MNYTGIRKFALRVSQLFGRIYVMYLRRVSLFVMLAVMILTACTSNSNSNKPYSTYDPFLPLSATPNPDESATPAPTRTPGPTPTRAQ